MDNGNGRWNPVMLQALNVTVENIVSAQGASKTPSEAVLTRSDPAEEVEGPDCASVGQN